MGQSGFAFASAKLALTDSKLTCLALFIATPARDDGHHSSAAHLLFADDRRPRPRQHTLVFRMPTLVPHLRSKHA
jgi:hypothetical protein